MSHTVLLSLRIVQHILIMRSMHNLGRPQGQCWHCMIIIRSWDIGIQNCYCINTQNGMILHQVLTPKLWLLEVSFTLWIFLRQRHFQAFCLDSWLYCVHSKTTCAQKGEKWPNQCWPRPFYSQAQQFPCAVTLCPTFFAHKASRAYLHTTLHKGDIYIPSGRGNVTVRCEAC